MESTHIEYQHLRWITRTLKLKAPYVSKTIWNLFTYFYFSGVQPYCVGWQRGRGLLHLSWWFVIFSSFPPLSSRIPRWMSHGLGQWSRHLSNLQVLVNVKGYQLIIEFLWRADLWDAAKTGGKFWIVYFVYMFNICFWHQWNKTSWNILIHKQQWQNWWLSIVLEIVLHMLS